MIKIGDWSVLDKMQVLGHKPDKPSYLTWLTAVGGESARPVSSNRSCCMQQQQWHSSFVRHKGVQPTFFSDRVTLVWQCKPYSMLNLDFLLIMFYFLSQFSCQVKMGRFAQSFPNPVHLAWKSSPVRSWTCEVCIFMCLVMPWDLSSSSSALWSSSFHQASGPFMLIQAWVSSWFCLYWRRPSHWCANHRWSCFRLSLHTSRSRKYRIACLTMWKACWAFMNSMFGSWLGIRLLVSFKKGFNPHWLILATCQLSAYMIALNLCMTMIRYDSLYVQCCAAISRQVMLYLTSSKLCKPAQFWDLHNVSEKTIFLQAEIRKVFAKLHVHTAWFTMIVLKN